MGWLGGSYDNGHYLQDFTHYSQEMCDPYNQRSISMLAIMNPMMDPKTKPAVKTT